MSTAVFPLGLESYNNTSNGPLGTAAYQTWKGTGPYSYPVAIAAGNVRPLTNNDPTNNAIQKHGLPRPLKWQYRKGTNAKTVITLDPNDPSKYVEISRESRRSTGSVQRWMDWPGQYSVKQNNTENEVTHSQDECIKCDGVSLVASYAPEPFLTNNPEPVSTTASFCCNEERKAKRRVLPANTNLPKQYYTSIKQYHQNRCQTYDQRVFNFDTNNATTNTIYKPGSPQAQSELYVANCYPDTTYNGENEMTQKLFAILKMGNVFTDQDIQDYYQYKITNIPDLYTFLQTIEGNQKQAMTIYTNFINNPYIGFPSTGQRGCKRVYYKPSNFQYATEGGVSSSARTLRLTVNTISSNTSSLRRLRGSSSDTINIGGQPFVPFIYKNKVAPPCQANTYFRNLNLKPCSYQPENILYKAFSKMGSIGGSVNGTQITGVGYTNV